MNKKALKVLEYNKIIELLMAEAGSDMAKERIGKYIPLSDQSFIREKLSETTEAATVIIQKGNLPLSDFYDIMPQLHLARKGGSLTMKELLHVLFNMKVTNDVVNFLKTDLPTLPIIDSMKELLVTFPKLVDKIDRSILSEDEMADNASSELKSIRKQILMENDAIRARLNHIINSSDGRMFLQDSVVTMRDGRFVVPVKAEHRGKVPGIVHDQSSSGATLFIEPQIIVELNNKLRELELAEQAEIDRILLELSGNVAEHFHNLVNNQKMLVELDIIFAKGKLSVKMHGEEPKINDEGYLELKKARHPLIDKKKVVPINVAIGKTYRTLVITGPNTGGKTVTLKTIGLLSMMAQSGLHIPASSESSIPIFADIFADIGDEQSIEQSLSTFSSHMKNTVEIIDKADFNSLVLLDELGAGTDPTEGAALAISILDRLKDQGAITVATTHYNELKKYALSTDGVENASMEFNIETLSPTYKLSIGIPGKSNAFEISRKIGLPDSIIVRANNLIEGRDLEFEDVISKIEQDKKKAETEKEEAERLSKEMKERMNDILSKEQALEKKQKEIIAKAKEDARDIIRDAKEVASDVQKELKSLSKVDSLGERNKRLAESKRKLNETEKLYQGGIVKEVNSNPVSKDDIKIGDRVKVLTLDQNGKILSLPDENGDVKVECGMMKIYVNIEDLMYIGETVSEKAKAKSKHGSMFRTKALTVSTSRNVIGLNLEDALMEVEKYLDDAYMAGLDEVTVIHGRGEGILQSGIRAMLRKHHLVESYHKGSFSDGGDGVTVVKIKKN